MPIAMRGQVAVWPEAPDARCELVDRVEDQLLLGDTCYRFVRLDKAGAGDAVTSSNGAAGRALFAWCRDRASSRGEGFDEMLTPRVAAELHRALTHRARELAARDEPRRDWKDPGALNWPLLLRSIIACIAAGASHRTAQREGISTLLGRLVDEVYHIIADLRPTPELALRMLRADDRPRLCRHHARVLAALFAAVLRAAGRDEPVFALEVTGRPYFSSPSGHCWNWFVDLARAQIVAIDLTGALANRSTDDDVFSTRLDWMAMNNVSAFLHFLFIEVWRSGSAAVVRDAMPQLIDPDTTRGQSLLYRLAQHEHLTTRARARIVHGLERRGFDAISDWRRVVEQVQVNPLLRAGARATFGDGTAQLQLLDAIGL
jgi:hypothetical protein